MLVIIFTSNSSALSKGILRFSQKQTPIIQRQGRETLSYLKKTSLSLQPGVLSLCAPDNFMKLGAPKSGGLITRRSMYSNSRGTFMELGAVVRGSLKKV